METLSFKKYMHNLIVRITNQSLKIVKLELNCNTCEITNPK